MHILLSGAFVYYQALDIRDDTGAQGRLTLGAGLWSNYLSQKIQFIYQQQ